MEFINIDALVKCYKQDPQMTEAKWVQWAQACAARVAHLDSHHSNEAAGYAAAGANYAANAARTAGYAASAAASAANYAANAAVYDDNATDYVAAFDAERLWQSIELMRIYHEGEG